MLQLLIKFWSKKITIEPLFKKISLANQAGLLIYFKDYYVVNHTNSDGLPFLKSFIKSSQLS